MSETYNLVDAAMKIIQDRRSIREFSDEPVADQDLDLKHSSVLVQNLVDK